MKYHFKLHKEDIGYWAECVELSGCQSQGDTLDEVKINVKEALEIFLDEYDDSMSLINLPDENIAGNDIITVEVDSEIAFAVYLRYFRVKNNMTQKQVADKLGMKNIYSYQRLERKSNPTLLLIKRVKRVFPDMSVDKII